MDITLNERVFTSPRTILADCTQALRNKCLEKGHAFNPCEMDAQPYQFWMQQIADHYKKEGRLLTEAQFEMIEAKRDFQEGDRVRYIGEAAFETSRRTGNIIPRPTKQLGRIIRVVRRPGNLPVLTFRQDISPQVRALAAQPDQTIEVLDLHTDDWKLFELVAGA